MSNRIGSTLTYTGTLVVTSCGVCSIRFAMPRDLEQRARQQGDKFPGFFCPQGHSLVYRDGENERLRRERDAALSQKTHLQDQLQATKADAEETRRTLVRERARFANGVCPCCNRSFTNVRRHMETKHPDYDTSPLLAGGSLFRCTCGRSFETYRGLRIHQGQASWGRHETKV